MPSRNNSFLALDIVGALELAQALRDLGTDRLIRATLKRALLKAAEPVAADARRRAPRGTSKDGHPHMADKIAVSTTLSRRQRSGDQRGWNARGETSDNTARVYIGAAPRGPAVLAEFGTGPRHTKKGKGTGQMPAQPFMRPAWDAGGQKVLEEFIPMLWAEIERSAARLARRTAKAKAKA